MQTDAQESAGSERIVEIRPRLDYNPSTCDLIYNGAIAKPFGRYKNNTLKSREP